MNFALKSSYCNAYMSLLCYCSWPHLSITKIAESAYERLEIEIDDSKKL